MGELRSNPIDEDSIEDPPVDVLRNTSTSAYYKSIEKNRYNVAPLDSDEDFEDAEDLDAS